VTARADVSVFEARASDLDALTHLFNDYRIFYGCEPALETTRDFIAQRLEEGATRFFLAPSGAEVAGFVHLLPSFDTLGMRDAWVLEDLFVAPAHRRGGIGSALLQRAETFARARGASRISLTTAHANETAQRLYLAHGYAHDEIFRAYHRVLV